MHLFSIIFLIFLYHKFVSCKDYYFILYNYMNDLVADKKDLVFNLFNYYFICNVFINLIYRFLYLFYLCFLFGFLRLVHLRFSIFFYFYLRLLFIFIIYIFLVSLLRDSLNNHLFLHLWKV
jgi:hypothetical protein